MRRTPAPLPWLGALLALYLVAPFIAGVPQAFLADWRSVDPHALLSATGVSVASATLATFIIALGGIPLGYLLARTSRRGLRVLGFVVQLPLALPPLTSGVLLLFLLGYQSVLGRATGGRLTDSFAGIVLAETFVAAPFLIIAARSAFAAIDPVLEGVAATLGRRPLEVFWRVSLPLAWPWLLSGMLLAWLRAFGEFGATVMVAYHPYSLPVYTYVAFGSQGLPSMLPILLPTLLAAGIIMASSGLLLPDLSPGARGAATQHAPTLAREPAATAPGVVLEQRVVSNSAAPASIADTTLSRDPVQPHGARAPALDVRLRRRLDGFDLQVEWQTPSRRLAVLGPSGSGKTLTLRLIAGLETLDAGSVRLGGQALEALEPAARHLGYVPQNYGLFPHLTVAQQLCFPAGADPQAARRWLQRLELAGLEGRCAAALSLGQQQRVALARALVRPAQALLLDEPFSALDTPLRRRLRQELRQLQAELPLLTLLVTHDAQEAALLAEELLLLEGGRVLQIGPMESVFRRPVSESAARLLGAEQSAIGTVRDAHTLELGDGASIDAPGPALVPGMPVGWSFPIARGRLSATGQYAGSVESVATAGTDRQVMVRVGGTRVRVLAGAIHPAQGSPCRFDIDAQAVQVWPLPRAMPPGG